MKEELESQPFVCRAYFKADLAALYLPEVSRNYALRKFNDWLADSPGLWAELQKVGVTKTTRLFTRLQVEVIVGRLGLP